MSSDLGKKLKPRSIWLASSIPIRGRIFLADGDALNLPKDRMIEILKYLRQSFRD